MNLTVHTNPSYEIVIEDGCLTQAGARAAALFPKAKRSVLVTDSNVGPLYAEKLRASLKQAGFAVTVYTFPAGEQSKTLSTIGAMYSAFSHARIARSDFVVALGGGVCGDMCGFAAATWLRGLPFIQVPTSLLAQVDSSVGGKTGVDLPEGKNLVGAFHQPSLVLIDPSTLSTLPQRFFTDGMGEVIKYGCIRSKSLFERLERDDCRRWLPELIYQCVDIKQQLVAADPMDHGVRDLLNFGHTFGHALETIQRYHGLTHGCAVGVGMVLMTRVSESMGITPPGTAARIAALLTRYGVPQACGESVQDLLRGTAHDKKNVGDGILLILLREIGDAFIHEVPRAQLPRLCEVLA